MPIRLISVVSIMSGCISFVPVTWQCGWVCPIRFGESKQASRESEKDYIKEIRKGK